MVNGFLLQNTANADLSTAARPTGAAATWYLFANRTAGSSAFTLTVNSSAVAGVDQRCIGRFYWDGSAIIPASIRIEDSFTWASLVNFLVVPIVQGRLTLTSADPGTVGDVTAPRLFHTLQGG